MQLARILMDNSHITTLALSGKNMGDAAAVALAAAIASMPSIVGVDMGSNGLGEVGGMALAHALRTSKSK